MFISNQLFILLALLAVVAAEIAAEASGDFASAVRECLVTMGVFTACVLLFSQYQKSTGNAVKRFDKLGHECPAIQRTTPGVERIRNEVLTESTYSKKPSAEVSKMDGEHVRLTELVHSLAKEGESLKAAVAMKMLEEKTGTPGLPEYSALIAMCSKGNDVEGAHMWMKRLQEKGHNPNVVCFNAMINAYAKCGDIHKAVAVAGEMRDAGVDSDVVTYNTIIDACARKGDAAEAQVWMKKMLAAGVKPSVVSFCSVMRACAKSGLNNDLEYWIEQANTLGIQLNMICFSAVINAFAQNGDLTSAERWLARMPHCNINPSVHCFLGMLALVCKDGDMERAARVVGKMRAMNVEPDARIYNMLLRTACQDGKIECAQNLIDDAAGKGISLSMQGISASLAAKLKIPSDVHMGNASSKKVASEAPATCEVNKGDAEACVGKRYVGMVKEFISGKFGYICCDDTYAIFKRDVFLSNRDNPEQFAKGQMVSFVLQIDQRRGQPRASDLKMLQR